MIKKVYNPYLPYWETVPDAEPHIFGDRLYVFGSHDELGGSDFCVQDYVGWSAPIHDLTDWRYEGVIYRKDQDPFYGAVYSKGELPRTEVTGQKPPCMYAPDVAKGPDGRFYLYYQLAGVDIVSVAVSDTPAGPYEFFDFVTREDGTVPRVGLWFDPAVLVEKDGIYLYYGFAPSVREEEVRKKAPGSFVLKMAADMHTIIEEPKLLAPGINLADGTSYEENPFYEASSIRKYGDLYYFVYSSIWSDNLCYATSKYPDRDFEYRGILVSNGDLGYQGNRLRTNYTGNNHGGITIVNGQAYIFWHRQTHGTSFSRQGCADKITIREDGRIDQTEITSCGLNDGALPAIGEYPSYIACHLTKKDRAAMGHVTYSNPGEPNPPIPEDMPYITEEKNESFDHGVRPFIYHFCEGCTAGFKYLEFTGQEIEMKLELRGKGILAARLDDPNQGKEVARFEMKEECLEWKRVSSELKEIKGTHALYIQVEEGCVDFASFAIVTIE